MSDLPPNRRPDLPETRAYIDGSGRYVRERPGTRTMLTMDGDMMRWAETTRITQEFLERLKHTRDQNKRAPLGDKHGAWQKIADIPMKLWAEKLPPHAWDDKTAIKKLLNDPEVRLFRADGDYRQF